jgi:hypothetical protein
MASRSNFLGGLSRSWFGVALLIVFLLAIPVFLLYGLNVFGGEENLNTLLQKRFQLTYHIPLAWWLALILLLVPLAIVLLYFLKLKRKPLSVPSTFLWRKSIEDLHVNALFQWLRNNLLLLLQLLIVLFLIYSVMDFRVHGRTGESKHYILMIDNSASMAATDVSPSRLHQAKLEALREIDASTDSDVGMVIVFNSSAEVVKSYTNNRGELRSAVEHIEQTQRPTRIEDAMSLADSLANPNRSADNASVAPTNVEPGKERTFVQAEGISTEVHLFSDGRFPDMPEFALGNLNLHFHTIGQLGPEHVDNVALVTLNALRDEQDPTKLQVFARALNFRNKPVDIKIQLELLTNGSLKGIQEKPLSLLARKVETVPQGDKEEPLIRDTPGEGAVVFELSDIDDQAKVVLHAKLVGIQDNLPLDDEAWLVLGVVRKARLLLVGPPNDILHAFFDDPSTQAVATISYLTPEDLTKNSYRKPALNGDFDLVIFDRCGPKTVDDMPRANTFFIGYPPPPWKREAGDKLTNPQIKGWMGKHPIMKYLAALQEVGIFEAFKLKDLPPRTPRLIEIDQNVSLLLTLTRSSYTDLVMTFPILNDKGEWNTNWPLLPSFPIFLRNVLYTLGNVSDGASEETKQPGEAKTLRPDVAVPQIQVTDPSGKTETLSRGTRPDFSYGDTNRVGVYRVAWNGAWQRSFAINLLDSDESNIEPRTSIHVGAELVAAGQERRQPRELWKWLVLAALALLLMEWYIYNRRVYV